MNEVSILSQHKGGNLSQCLRFVMCCISLVIGIAHAQELEVIGYNVESGGADPDIVAQRIIEIDGCDIWGLSEVRNQGWANIFEVAAEDGENADFIQVLGTTGGADKLLIIFNSNKFDLVDSEELHDINVSGTVRAPLVARLKIKSTGNEFYFMVNHLYRSKADKRHLQATLLNNWAESQQIPVIAVGDYNFDWSVTNGDTDHDDGYDNMIADSVFEWIRPTTLYKTQDSNYNSILDFVFVSGDAKNWDISST
ncbi:MAG: hypothetical protein GY808_00735, partial [Gammaproteobacteria bacterium]|nr:hypothetical protein [Gammaproteobacteria bacterium]